MRLQRGWTMQIPLLLLGLLSLKNPLVYAQDQRYQDLVNEFIQEYNMKSGSENLKENLFRSSILNLQSGENKDPAASRLLNFTMRETVCPNTENPNPDECDFKENGLVKECIGAIALDSPKPSADISCDGPEKNKRIGLFRLFRGLLRRVGPFSLGLYSPGTPVYKLSPPPPHCYILLDGLSLVVWVEAAMIVAWTKQDIQSGLRSPGGAGQVALSYQLPGTGEFLCSPRGPSVLPVFEESKGLGEKNLYQLLLKLQVAKVTNCFK
ncbi:cathelicidin antimicrobial peptide-like [Vombatus ursinus]|uniref:cathelicidin antimicrobial peptide-like n=1 Tax=Vombatus ursinus TaxID=29139 RepID=UPI000FFD086B|nr:cathelicidin antimicrobial peptide-like [Vombatus ursinus]